MIVTTLWQPWKKEGEILFDLSNTPIIYFARCCDEDEDEEIPKEDDEEERGNWRRAAGKNMARKMSAGHQPVVGEERTAPRRRCDE